MIKDYWFIIPLVVILVLWAYWINEYFERKKMRDFVDAMEKEWKEIQLREMKENNSDEMLFMQ
jgi:hypothetical protein